MSRLTSDCQKMPSMLDYDVKVGVLVFMMAMSWSLTMVTLIAVPILTVNDKVVVDKMAKKQRIIQFAGNLRNLTNVVSGIMEAVGVTREFIEMISRKPQFELTNVGFTYSSRPNNPVLTDQSLLMKSMVGPSGGGKSSIVSLIEHFYEPTTGDITMDGIPIKDIDHVYYHQKVALVAQEPILYNGSVRHNILYGCDFATEDDMLKASKMANVHDFVTELEKGYDTNCEEKGVQMSGGQKQRIAIARALVRNPAVLILDEATSALDTESESLVLVAQEPILYNGSVRHNILYGCEFATEEDMIRASKMANLHEFVVELEKGYDTNCGQNGVEISGGGNRLSTIEKADKSAVIVKGYLVQTGTDGMDHSLTFRQLLVVKTT